MKAYLTEIKAHHFISTLEIGGDYAVKMYYKYNIDIALKASVGKGIQQVKKCLKPCQI